MADEMRCPHEECRDIVRVDLEVFGFGVRAVTEAASIHEPKMELLRERLLRLPGHLRTENVAVDENDRIAVALVEHLDRCPHAVPPPLVVPAFWARTECPGNGALCEPS